MSPEENALRITRGFFRISFKKKLPFPLNYMGWSMVREIQL